MLFDDVDERWQGRTVSHTILGRQAGSSALRRVAGPRLRGSTQESHLGVGTREQRNTWCAAMTAWVLALAMMSIKTWRVMQDQMRNDEEKTTRKPS